MKLQTDRLLIRPWTLDDVPHYQEMSKDVGFNCFTPPGFYLVRNDDEARDRIRDRIARFEFSGSTKFPLFEKSSGDFVGICGGDLFDLKRGSPPAPGTRAEDSQMELGYRLLLKHWGKGYATEAATALIRYLHQDLGRSTIYGFALPQNRPSLKILESLGFVFERDFEWAELQHRLYRHEE